ncbi:tyrosine-protein phosphatase [Lacticaseibacillus baoqingensis]|uniref:Tyrosine-protein phosphatase n=1 Tax=Lacticaseibacillus baoqingensis TaxID=2486013 RepID=A0ABW4E742_9LACO|nr:tyrosine-protein phosphatase [Lacticaseibacillus baoqingensis]
MRPERLLPIPHAINLRELGGYPTEDGRYLAWRKLLRSGTLGYLEPADGQALVAYGVRFDVDFRSDNETQTRPDRIPQAIRYQQLPVYPFVDRPSLFKRLRDKLRGDNDLETIMANTYGQMLTDSHANAAYQQLIALLLRNTQPDTSLLFHCTAGKDRTGIAAMMIQGALGVSAPVMREDYLLTNLVLEAPEQMAQADLRHGADHFVNQMNAHQAETSNYDAVSRLIAKEYGDWPNYLQKQLHFSAGDLTDLRQLYLTDDPEPKD